MQTTDVVRASEAAMKEVPQMEPGKRIQVRWSTARAGELRGEVTWGVSEDAPHKIVFLDNYRPERASSYRGVLPGNGEEWICEFVRDTQPDNSRKGALIVRLASKATERWEIVGEVGGKLFGVSADLKVARHLGLRPEAEWSGNPPEAIVRRQSEHKAARDAAEARLRVICAEVVARSPRATDREVKHEVVVDGLAGTLVGGWAGRSVGEAKQEPVLRSWVFEAPGCSRVHLGTLDSGPVFDGILWSRHTTFDLEVVDYAAACAQLGEPQSVEVRSSSLLITWPVFGGLKVWGSLSDYAKKAGPASITDVVVGEDGWLRASVTTAGLEPASVCLGRAERARLPEDRGQRAKSGVVREIAPAQLTKDFESLGEQAQGEVLAVLKDSRRSQFAHEVEYLAGWLERRLGKAGRDLRGVLALAEGFDASLRTYQWQESEGGDDDPFGGWREHRWNVTGRCVTVKYVDSDGKPAGARIASWHYERMSPVLTIGDEELSFAGNADENRYNAVRVLLHQMRQEFRGYRDEMRSARVLPLAGELDQRIYDGSPIRDRSAEMQVVYEQGLAFAEAIEAEVAMLEAEAQSWLAAHVPADLEAVRERAACLQREQEAAVAMVARAAAREAEIRGLAEARAAFEAGTRIEKLQVTCDDRRYGLGRVLVIRSDGTLRKPDAVETPGNRESIYIWNQITDEVVLVEGVLRAYGAADRWHKGGTGVVWRPNGVTPAQVEAVEVIEKNAGIAAGTFEVSSELIERRAAMMGEIRNEILRFSPKESKVPELRFLDVSHGDGWCMESWWGGYDYYISPARTRVQNLRPPLERGASKRVVHSVRCAGGVLEFLGYFYGGGAQLNAHWRELTEVEQSAPVAPPPASNAAQHEAVARRTSFSHAGNRKFKCACGVSTDLDKSTFSRVCAGEVLTITCSFCKCVGEIRTKR